MELSKLLIKLFYLVIIYVICFMILTSQTPLTNFNLYIITLLIAILIVYFTFDLIYNFLVNSQIVFKSNSNDSDDESDKNTGKSRTEYDTTTNVNKSNKSSQDYTMNHSHKYIQDNVFN